MKQTARLPGVMMLASLLFIINASARAEAVRPTVMYDHKTDTLSVTANNASYQETMALVATRSGIEILMDPKAEHNISITLKDTPLEKGLTELSRQTNFAFFYSDAKASSGTDQKVSAKPVLTRMHVLPKGEASNHQLTPLLAPGGEAFIREKDRNFSAQQTPKMFNYAQQRWDARLKMMNPEQREQLLAGAKEKQAQLEQRQAERKKTKEEHAKIREEHKQRRLDELAKLKTSNPELYERKMQQEAARHPGIKPAQ